MTRLIAAAAALILALSPAQQAPVFRTSTNAVMVDVNVRDAQRRVLDNLTATDFIVLDNGVAQQVDEVSYGKLPIDVTVGLDVSYSVTGPLLDQLRRAVTQLTRDLKKGDRLKLMLFNQRVNRTVDFTTDTAEVERAMRAATAGGATAVFDSLSVAMVSASAPDRRQLIMFFTDGNDAASTTTPATLMKVAERARATVSFVVLPTTSTVGVPSGTNPASVTIPTIAGQPGGARSIVFAPNSTLSKLALDTGGTIMTASGTADLGPSFLRVLDTFRTTYVLYFSPRGVDRGGFHTLSVSVNKPGAVVQARRGYFGG